MRHDTRLQAEKEARELAQKNRASYIVHSSTMGGYYAERLDSRLHNGEIVYSPKTDS